MEFLNHAHGFTLGGLSTEFTMLAIAMVLYFVHLFIAINAITAERGAKWNTGARDDTPPLKGKLPGRLDRAFQNYKETFVVFAAAAIALAVVGRHNGWTVWGAELYVAARIVYLPLYALGVPLLRTLVWLAGTIGIVLLIAALLGLGG